MVLQLAASQNKSSSQKEDEGDKKKEGMEVQEARYIPPITIYEDPRFYEPRPRVGPDLPVKFQAPKPNAKDHWTQRAGRRFTDLMNQLFGSDEPRFTKPDIHYHYHPEHNYIHHFPNYPLYHPHHYTTPPIYVKPIKPVKANVVKLESIQPVTTPETAHFPYPFTTENYRMYDPKFIELLTQIYKETDGFTKSNPFQYVNGNYGLKETQEGDDDEEHYRPIVPVTFKEPVMIHVTQRPKQTPPSVDLNDFIVPTTYKPRLNIQAVLKKDRDTNEGHKKSSGKKKKPDLSEILETNKYLKSNKTKYPGSIQDQLPPPRQDEDTRIPYVTSLPAIEQDGRITFPGGYDGTNQTDTDNDIDIRFAVINSSVILPDFEIPVLPLEIEKKQKPYELPVATPRETVIPLTTGGGRRIRFPDENIPESTEKNPVVTQTPNYDQSIERITNLTVIGLSEYRDMPTYTNPYSMRSLADFMATERGDRGARVSGGGEEELKISPRALDKDQKQTETKSLNLKVVADEEFKNRNKFYIGDELSLDAKILKDTDWDGFTPSVSSGKVEQVRKVTTTTFLPTTTEEQATTTTTAPETTTTARPSTAVVETRITKTVSKGSRRRPAHYSSTTTHPRGVKKYRRRQKYTTFTPYPDLLKKPKPVGREQEMVKMARQQAVSSSSSSTRRRERYPHRRRHPVYRHTTTSTEEPTTILS